MNKVELEQWTGGIVGRMHNKRVTYDELAAELGVKKSYVSAILNGHRNPPNAQERLSAALEAIIARREETDNEG